MLNQNVRKQIFSTCLAVVLSVSLLGCSANSGSSNSVQAQGKTVEASKSSSDSQLKIKVHSPEQPFNVVEKGEKVREFVNHKIWSCSVYVLSSKKGNIVVDPGFYDEEIKEYLTSIGGVDTILLTHGHVDHIIGIDDMKKDFPKAKLYIYDTDLPLLTDPKLNVSSGMGLNIVVQTKAEGLKEGDNKFGGYDVKVINTPGHTAGSCIYYFPEENIVFTGDSIMSSIESPTDRPTGSAQDIANSEKKFVKYGFKDDTIIYAGHFGNTTYSRIIKTNPSLAKLQ